MIQAAVAEQSKSSGPPKTYLLVGEDRKEKESGLGNFSLKCRALSGRKDTKRKACYMLSVRRFNAKLGCRAYEVVAAAVVGVETKWKLLYIVRSSPSNVTFRETSPKRQLPCRMIPTGWYFSKGP